ncbi:hypothetical protein A2U01_0005398 [Trifolium medium]|uniref:Uncharacterized protein n=1 Tax=Trifolium medium TaxID=97028 RepID=A0A392MAV4_9FABA|nr:hypothetical protein [Trifolium medium]
MHAVTVVVAVIEVIAITATRNAVVAA